MYDILFVGAGVHGAFLACNLIARGWTTPARLALIDPWPAPLHMWRRNTARCGMRFLRSTSSHNMTDDFHALRGYARTRGYTEDHFLHPYSRPTLDLFNRHAEEILARSGVDRRLLRGRAVTLERAAPAGPRAAAQRAVAAQRPKEVERGVAAGNAPETGWIVHTDNGDVPARNVVLAVGRSEEPRFPDWATHLPTHAPVNHVFARPGTAAEGDPAGRGDRSEGGDSGAGHAAVRTDAASEEVGADNVTVVGGGISAVQTALSLAHGGRRVTLLSRHAIRVAHFDSDPCFMGPRCLSGFLALPTAAERLQAIRSARTPGTIPWDVAEGLDAALTAGTIQFIQDDVDGATMTGSALRLHLRGGGAHETDRVILATGFDPGPPRRELLAAISRDAGLPLNTEGYPAIDRFLRWERGFFVTSALAELELGPMAPNIYGAHAALRRILPALAGTEEAASRVLSPWNPLRESDRRAG